MGILLFCTAEEAKLVVPEILATEQSQGIDLYVLAQYRNPDQARQNSLVELKDGETFENDFIGAHETDCQSWAREQIALDKSLDAELIAIADQRSARDKTIMMQFFNKKPGIDFPPYGILPPEEEAWYSFRIPAKDAFTLVAALTETALDVAYPVYFGRKDEFTNEQGVFEVHRADNAAAGEHERVA
ncbi:hypothetical protein PFICI_05766 [Pestalotiopsis fici W106-1]|uniref:Uncharacterized protein n=1 Tax=Pestalotiopsis fici (strain W106-1 / CGMCC3.15140) TaxID=1229662 RepID=W3XCV2_PESFW|nr:uncharacterized protein PFICI_05766 [Pestalotiopsis fici W106-1]ETS83890.1 hypothetical protein PFICI_05766 [Pestalotiopsis fici W106-1]